MKKSKSKRPTFEEVTYDKTFKVVGAGDMPKGEHFWCAFCGGRGIHFVLLERNDGQAFKVGHTCIGKVGLELPKSVAKVTIKRVSTEEKKPAKVEKEKKPAKVEKKEKAAKVEKEKKVEKVKKPEKVEKKKPEEVVKKEEDIDIEDAFEDM